MIRRCVIRGALLSAVLLIVGVVDAPGQDGGVRVVLDNEAVQVVFLTFEPGEIVEEHVNPEAELGIVLEGELTLITPAGREILKPGTVRWLAPLTPHETRNEGATPVKMWGLLLKQTK